MDSRCGQSARGHLSAEGDAEIGNNDGRTQPTRPSKTSSSQWLRFEPRQPPASSPPRPSGLIDHLPKPAIALAAGIPSRPAPARTWSPGREDPTIPWQIPRK
jgi:hypothetical protein